MAEYDWSDFGNCDWIFAAGNNGKQESESKEMTKMN